MMKTLIQKVFRLVRVLSILAIIACNNTPTLYMTGDSTMANKPVEANPEKGWGQLLPEYFNHELEIENHAKNGRSTRSFIYEGRWDSVLSILKKGDYVVIQFGHNDGSIQKTERYCTPLEYRYNLTKYIKDVWKLGAKPILCTSIQRRKFDSLNKLIDTHGPYPEIVRELADEYHVTLIDMQKKSHELIESMGVEDSKSLFLHVQPGKYQKFPDGKIDNTHFVEKGAFTMAGLFVDGLKENHHELTKYLKDEFKN